jgi:hypothetical protein
MVGRLMNMNAGAPSAPVPGYPNLIFDHADIYAKNRPPSTSLWPRAEDPPLSARAVAATVSQGTVKGRSAYDVLEAAASKYHIVIYDKKLGKLDFIVNPKITQYVALTMDSEEPGGGFRFLRRV